MNLDKSTMEQPSAYNQLEKRKPKKNCIPLILCCCIAFYCLLGCDHSNTRQHISIENGKITLAFEENTGAFLIFRNSDNSHDFLDPRIIPESLWEIDFLHPSGIKTIDMTTPSEFHFSKRDPYSLILTWDNFKEIENKDFKVTALVTLQKNESLSSWKISLEGTKGEKVRYRGLKYLLRGKFLRSPDMEFPEEELKMSRLSIYAGKTGESVTIFQKRYPLIYSGTWKSDDNQVGIAMACISDDPFRVDFSFNSDDYELPSSGRIYFIDAEEQKFMTTYSNGKILVDFTLQPKELCITEIVPNI